MLLHKLDFLDAQTALQYELQSFQKMEHISRMMFARLNPIKQENAKERLDFNKLGRVN